MADYGIDFYGVDDLTFALTTVTGPLAAVQAFARRLITPSGSVDWDDEQGFDLRRYLNAPVEDTGSIERGIEAEGLKDERISGVTSRVTFAEEKLTAAISTLMADGSVFEFTLSVDALTIELLTGAA